MYGSGDKSMNEEKAIKIIKEYFYLETDKEAKELFETNKERFTDDVLGKMDWNNFKMESLRKDPRRQYIFK